MTTTIIFIGLVLVMVAFVGGCEAASDWYWGRKRTRERILRSAQNDGKGARR